MGRALVSLLSCLALTICFSMCDPQQNALHSVLWNPLQLTFPRSITRCFHSICFPLKSWKALKIALETNVQKSNFVNGQPSIIPKVLCTANITQKSITLTDNRHENIVMFKLAFLWRTYVRTYCTCVPSFLCVKKSKVFSSVACSNTSTRLWRWKEKYCATF